MNNIDFSENSDHFDQAAATWDEKPQRMAITKAVAEAMKKHIKFSPEMRVMEYGCGTASLSFLLSDLAKEVIATDASEGMIEQAKLKIAAANSKNISACRLDLINDPLPDEKFDLICNVLVMHHVEETDLLLKKFAETIKPGGQLAIADLYEEDGLFHMEKTVPHNGFDPAALGESLERAGFKEIQFTQIYEIERPQPDDGTKMYPLFLCSCRKKDK